MGVKTYTKHVPNRNMTPQTEQIPDSNQVPNAAGGWGYEVNNWTKLERFLILGTESGTYYATEKALTLKATENLKKVTAEDGVRVVNTVVNISDTGRAPKNDAALFVLAYVAKNGNDAARRAAYDAYPKVARIGTHRFGFAEALQSVSKFQGGGWSRGARNAVGSFYLGDLDQVVYDVIKYRQRNGWTHADLLRLTHPKTDELIRRDLFAWIVDGTAPREGTIPLLDGFLLLQGATNGKVAANLIRQYNLPREAVPTDLLNSIEVWEALLEKMPITALIRNLGKMSAIGLLKPMSNASNKVVTDLSNDERLRKGRVHPITILAALKTYAQGHGERGSLTWEPVQHVVDALDMAFYASFGNVTPTNKRLLLACDVSSSMMGSPVAGMPFMSAAEATGAMALVTAATEKNYAIYGFTTNFRALSISPRQRLDNVVSYMYSMGFGGTDCALPMQYALQNKIPVDAFVIYTDSETWAGRSGHPSQALVEYRRKMGIPAKLIVSAFSTNEVSIADPADGGMLDCVGMDTSTPQIMSDFIRGNA